MWIIFEHALNSIIPLTNEHFMNLYYEKNYYIFIIKRDQVSRSITGFSYNGYLHSIWFSSLLVIEL